MLRPSPGYSGRPDASSSFDVSGSAGNPGVNPRGPGPARFDHDVLVVGGGVNGAGIARDAAGRGLSVLLCEQDDLASHTSSASTKLIHGGLRYLERYEFRLVRKSLLERESLLRSAPHIMQPLRFVMPHDPSMRPVWIMRAGIWLYDHLARREILPASNSILLAEHPAGEPLKPGFSRAFVYSDGRVDDARLVVLCARDAADRGAMVLTRTRCVEAKPEGGGWRVRLLDRQGMHSETSARALINATGPWAKHFLDEVLHQHGPHSLRLVKGSHIVVPRLFSHDLAYLFQNPDGRIVFAIPYEQDFTLIGTTDVDHHADPGNAHIDVDEIDYLRASVERYFRRSIERADVVWSFSGVRPLLDDESGDPSSVTRDYRLELDRSPALLLNVWGGKITTFRKLAEEAVDLLAPMLGNRAGAWTHDARLPGGDLSATRGAPRRPDLDFARFVEAKAAQWPWLPTELLRRYAQSYGSRVDRIVGDARCLQDLGPVIVSSLYEAELRYLMREEWASEASDVVWRRTKLGLRLQAGEVERLEGWMSAHRAGNGACMPASAGHAG